MDKVTLEYNPYVKNAIVVEFNGKKPLINSQVEKYQNRKLQDWLSEIPHIFHDEMNGYDFEIEYTGTKMEFEQLKEAFRDAGVTEDQVELFHKNEYNSREQKLEAIDDILLWLANEPNNGIFDIDAFWKQNREVLQEEYTIKTINGGDQENDFSEKYRITVEDIDQINDLDSVSLCNTPIIVCVTEDLLSGLQSIVRELRGREDVEERQLFFIIDNSLNQDMVKRIIKDHGIKCLQIVTSMKDEAIKEYYYAYPVTDHIIQMIELLEKQEKTIQAEISSRIIKSEKTSDIDNEKLNKLGERLKRHRRALNKFENRPNITLPFQCIEAREQLYSEIETWKKNLVMIPEEHAEQYARAYNEVLAGYYSSFVKQVSETIENEKANILNDYRKLYEATQYLLFEPEIQLSGYEGKKEYPNLTKQFMELKQGKYVKPKVELKDRLFGDADLRPHVYQTIYYCKEWRDHAVNILIPMAKREINRQYKAMVKELDKVAEAYISHLKSVINEIEDEKKNVVSRLSAQERNNQEDKNWIDHLHETISGLKED